MICNISGLRVHKLVFVSRRRSDFQLQTVLIGHSCHNLVILSRCKRIKHRYEVNTNSLIHHGFQTPCSAHVLTSTTADHYNLPLKEKRNRHAEKKEDKKLYKLIESHSNNN